MHKTNKKCENSLVKSEKDAFPLWAKNSGKRVQISVTTDKQKLIEHSITKVRKKSFFLEFFWNGVNGHVFAVFGYILVVIFGNLCKGKNSHRQ